MPRPIAGTEKAHSNGAKTAAFGTKLSHARRLRAYRFDSLDELDRFGLGRFARWHNGLRWLRALRGFERSFQRQHHVQNPAYVPDCFVVHASIYQADLDSISVAMFLRTA